MRASSLLGAKSRRGANIPTEDDYIARGRELLDQAVAAAMGDGDAALLMSGGLNSSAIAATAARLGHSERLDCYTIVAPADSNVDFGTTRYSDDRDKVEAWRECIRACG